MNPFLTYGLISSGIATAKSFLDYILQGKDRKSIAEESYLRHLDEVEYKAKLDEQAQYKSHQYQIERAFLNQKHAIDMEKIRAQIRIDQKSEENSPFVEPSQETIAFLREKFQCNQKPLVLISPFWDDNLPDRANDGGGYQNYRIPLIAAVQEIDSIAKCDGFFKRPLRYEDLDVAKISSVLADIPVILIYGRIEAKQRIYPAITVWNVIPGQEGRYFQLKMNFFDRQAFDPQKSETSNFQDYIAQYTATIVRVLSDAYHQLGAQTDEKKNNTIQSPEKQTTGIVRIVKYDYQVGIDPLEPFL